MSPHTVEIRADTAFSIRREFCRPELPRVGYQVIRTNVCGSSRRRHRVTRVAGVLIALVSGACVQARTHAALISPLHATAFLDEHGAKAQLLMVGTYHFANPGLDAYKQAFSVDMLSHTKQEEIEDVVERLARFNPTRVAVEAKPEQQARLDSLYQAYRDGRFTLTSNEVYQLGFRLAKRLGHTRVYAIDAPSRSYFPGMTSAQFDAKVHELGQDSLRHTVWQARFNSLYRFEDSLKTVRTLREFLLYLNDPASINASHGAYVVGTFRLGIGADYFGPDDATEWYNRNLRIFNNVQRITAASGERIVMIIGAGHLPVLRFLALASPEYRVAELSTYLASPGR